MTFSSNCLLDFRQNVNMKCQFGLFKTSFEVVSTFACDLSSKLCVLGGVECLLNNPRFAEHFPEMLLKARKLQR